MDKGTYGSSPAAHYLADLLAHHKAMNTRNVDWAIGRVGHLIVSRQTILKQLTIAAEDAVISNKTVQYLCSRMRSDIETDTIQLERFEDLRIVGLVRNMLSAMIATLARRATAAGRLRNVQRSIRSKIDRGLFPNDVTAKSGDTYVYEHGFPSIITIADVPDDNATYEARRHATHAKRMAKHGMHRGEH